MSSVPDTLTQFVQAAIGVARSLGITRVEPILLHHSQHISIRLHPFDIVARVAKIENSATDAKMRRELAVVQYLVNKQAPVAPPMTKLPAGPHRHDEFAVTLWQFVDHVPADPDNAQHMVQAATALHEVHKALADFPGELPSFKVKIDECRVLLESRSALRAIRAEDRAFLLATYHCILASLDAYPMNLAPIHGDTHLGNVFMTHNGAVWNDFEDTSLGPREWDIGWVHDTTQPIIKPIDHELLSVLRDLRSLCVSVWCWDKYHLPEKQEAAQYHLGYLRKRFA